MYVQLTLFDEEQVQAGTAARSLFDGSETKTEDVPGWVLRIVPEAAALIHVGDQPCALQKKPLTQEQVQRGHEYYHYLINGSVYAGTFVGAE